MPEKQLVVIGDGPELSALRAKATPNIQILGYCEFHELLDYMQRARAFVFAADEDFGIMPVEAQACGTPVIAYGRGGSLETVVHGRTGMHFEQQNAQCLAEAVDQFETVRHQFDPEAIREHAERFSPERFRHEMATLLDHLWDRFCLQNRSPAAMDAVSTPYPFDPDQIGFDLSSEFAGHVAPTPAISAPISVATPRVVSRVRVDEQLETVPA